LRISPFVLRLASCFRRLFSAAFFGKIHQVVLPATQRLQPFGMRRSPDPAHRSSAPALLKQAMQEIVLF